MMAGSQISGIARDRTVPAVVSAGASAIALTSLVNAESALWKKAIDQMLAWRNPALADNCGDFPACEIVDTAIDFAMDQFDGGSCAPDSIMPSGAGRIAMEWNNQNATMILEFIGLGSAVLTMFDSSGKIVERRSLERNPKSRKLEPQG